MVVSHAVDHLDLALLINILNPLQHGYKWHYPCAHANNNQPSICIELRQFEHSGVLANIESHLVALRKRLQVVRAQTYPLLAKVVAKPMNSKTYRKLRT